MNNFKILKKIACLLIASACLFLAVSCEYIDIKTVNPTNTTEIPTTEIPVSAEDTAKTELEEGFKVLTKTDGDGRVTEEFAAIYKNGEAVTVICKKSYEYTEDGMLLGLVYENGDSYKYTYDDNGKVTAVSKNGSIMSEYGYCDRGYLIWEDNLSSGKSYEYSYDEMGNMISQRVFSYKNKQTPLEEYEYKYENGVLTESRGKEVKYNSLGNPTEYQNSRDYILTWRSGDLRLDSVLCDGADIRYEYGSHGQRSVKIVDGVRYEYKWSRMKLSELAITDTDGNKYLLTFSYTDSGTPIMFTCNEKNYYYKVNISGDVEEIFTEEGTVGRYFYDAWGRQLEVTSSDKIVELNPIRYRGYVYDNETGLYYLHTRYYDPTIGRRLNGDGYSTGGAEVYVYGENDPVLNIDPTMMVEYPICNELHLYSEKEKPVTGKVNVIFKPNISNPVFQIENSYKITDANQQKAILEYIMASDFYDQSVYCRTVQSMLTEWKAHNHIFEASPNERCRHVDFDRNDEGVSYSDFWKRAMKEYGI